MSIRKLLHLLHLWAALLAGVFLLILGLTGSFMAYETALDHALNRRLVDVHPAAQRLGLADLRLILEKDHPGYQVTDFAFSPDPGRAYEAHLEPGAGAGKGGISLAFDPYTGKTLGDLRTANVWVNRVHQFHTHLLLDTHRDVAQFIVGYASIFLLFLACSGIVLWWRRKLFTVKRRVKGKRLNFDLHSVIGIYSSLFLFVFALTGVALSWERPMGRLVDRITHAPAQPPARPMAAPAAGAIALGPDALVAAAQAALPGAQLSSLAMSPGRPADVRMKFPEDRTPAGRSRVILDPYTGQVLQAVSTRTAPIGFKISRMWIRELHTGDLFGGPTRLLACIMSLLLPAMAITGTLIWWNRGRRLTPPPG